MSFEAPTPSQSTRSTVLNHTIPPFYACYLLRSFSTAKGRQGRTYIGSTPDPPRRWKQHNGHIKGGAFKTRLGRPWEMEMIVYGFPSKLQALQFEWAWQNPQASRHLHFRPTSSTSDPTNALPPTALFPRTTLSNRPLTKVQVLQYMLTVPPWSHFDLKIMFFSMDAEEWWSEALEKGAVVGTGRGRGRGTKGKGKGKEKERGWGEREMRIKRVEITRWFDGVDGKRGERAKGGGRLLLEEEEEEEESGEEVELAEEIKKIVVDDYDFARPQWNKWEALASTNATRHKCFICSEPISTESHLDFLLCTSSSSSSSATCTATFHLPCLATHFLSTSSPSTTLPSQLLPISGTCPSCKTQLQWQYLVRSSFRRCEASVGKGVGKVKGRRKKKVGEEKGKGRGKGRKAGKDLESPSEKEDNEETDEDEDEDEDEDVFVFSDIGE